MSGTILHERIPDRMWNDPHVAHVGTVKSYDNAIFDCIQCGFDSYCVIWFEIKSFAVLHKDGNCSTGRVTFLTFDLRC